MVKKTKNNRLHSGYFQRGDNTGHVNNNGDWRRHYYQPEIDSSYIGPAITRKAIERGVAVYGLIVSPVREQPSMWRYDDEKQGMDDLCQCNIRQASRYW